MRLFDRYPVLRRVIVSLKSGNSVRGYVSAYRRDYLVLKSAEMLRAQGVIPMDGELLIERSNVDFIQVIGTESGA